MNRRLLKLIKKDARRIQNKSASGDGGGSGEMGDYDHVGDDDEFDSAAGAVDDYGVESASEKEEPRRAVKKSKKSGSLLGKRKHKEAAVAREQDANDYDYAYEKE
mmetsp:Transcript_24804/g.33200  ORF Transcript_24804/g.33200 Transcript_24804/m.33200 type:complete len:105 (-) Transcript_24804:55-369(-)